MSDGKDESKAHHEQCKILFQLEEAIDTLNEEIFDASRLKQLKINIEHMTLNSKSELKPRFFMPSIGLSRPSDKLLCESRSHLASEDDGVTDPVDRARLINGHWEDYAFQELWKQYNTDKFWREKSVGDYVFYKDLYKYDQPEFGTFTIRDIPGQDFPHIKAIIYHNLEVEQGMILRGELLITLRLMLRQLRLRRLERHKIAPHFVVSFFGKRARALESYFDGQTLLLRSSALYNFPEQTSIAFKSFAEWYLGPPSGNTL